VVGARSQVGDPAAEARSQVGDPAAEARSFVDGGLGDQSLKVETQEA